MRAPHLTLIRGGLNETPASPETPLTRTQEAEELEEAQAYLRRRLRELPPGCQSALLIEAVLGTVA